MAESKDRGPSPDRHHHAKKTEHHEKQAAPEHKSHTWIWISAVAVCAVAILVFFLTRGESAADQKKAHAPPPVAVSVATVTQGDLGVRVDALGTVTPVQAVTVTSRVQGQVLKVLYTEGQMVKPGDPLVEIDPRPYQAALLQARGQLQRDQATLVQNKTNLRRYQQAFRQNAISKQQLDDQVQAVKQFEGAVLSDQGSVDNAEVNLQYCHITSPLAGRVGLRLVDAGNMLQAGSNTPLVVITQLQPITIIFSVPEDSLFEIQAQSMKKAAMPVEAFDRSETKKIANGLFQTLDNQVDPTTGTVRIKATFDNRDFALFPNEFVNAKLLVRTEHGLMRIPSAAVQKGVQGSFVYLINQDETVHVQPVETGLTDQGLTAVTGLQVGARVAMSNFDKLQDKAKVKIREEGGAKAPAAQLLQPDPNAVRVISGSTRSAESVDQPTSDEKAPSQGAPKDKAP